MLTAYASQRLLDYNFGQTAYDGGMPSAWYVGLSTTAVNFDGTGYTEPVGNSYARVQYLNNKPNWTVATNQGVLYNGVQITFPESSGTGWGNILSVLLWNQVSGGQIWWYDNLTSSRAVPGLTTVVFSAYSLGTAGITITLNNTV